jgi:anti-sigma factor RsiW
MSCNLTEKVSLLIDGELAQDEAEQIKKHIAVCSICNRASEDFLSLRQQIKSYEFEPDREARRQALARILASEPVSLWRKKLALPVPIFALVMLTMMVFAGWAIFLRATPKPLPPGIRPVNKASDAMPAPAPQNNFDLSRFDHGQRAEIYTARRTPQQ